MNKDKMIADTILFIMTLLLALSFVCGSWFAGFEPKWFDLFLRLSGSAMVFILGGAYHEWWSSRRDKK